MLDNLAQQDKSLFYFQRFVSQNISQINDVLNKLNKQREDVESKYRTKIKS